MPILSFRRKTPLLPKEDESVNLSSPAKIEFIHHELAAKKLNALAYLLEKAKADYKPSTGLSPRPLYAYVLAWRAQSSQIQRANTNPALAMPVGWDMTLDMPAHPFMQADIAHFAESTLPTHDVLRKVLCSFSGWTLLTRETAMRCHSGMVLKKTTFDIMLNHVIRTDSGKLHFKQLVGVQSDDMSELAEYFNFDHTSKVIDHLNIIYSYQATIARTGTADNSLSIADVEMSASPLFSHKNFEQRLTELSVPASPATTS